MLSPQHISDQLMVKYGDRLVSAREAISILRPYVNRSGGFLISEEVMDLVLSIFLAFRPSEDFRIKEGRVSEKVLLPLSNRAFESALAYLGAIALLNGGHSVTREMLPHLVDTWADRLIVNYNGLTSREPNEVVAARLITEVTEVVLNS